MIALVKKELGPGLMGFLPGGAYLHMLRLMRGRLASRLLRYVPHSVRLEDFSRPRLIVTCTDLVTKRCVALDHGSAANAVVASCSLPGVAKPVLDGPMVLVDGGVADNCPCHVLREQNVDVIVAVDASGIQPTPIRPGRTPGLVQTLLRCWEAQRGLPPATPDTRARRDDPSRHVGVQLCRFLRPRRGRTGRGRTSGSRGSHPATSGEIVAKSRPLGQPARTFRQTIPSVDGAEPGVR